MFWQGQCHCKDFRLLVNYFHCVMHWHATLAWLLVQCCLFLSPALTWKYEPSHEIMVLFVLRKPILQKRMRSHLVGLDVYFLVGPFFYFHTSCVQTAKALARLRRCAGSSESSLVAYVISAIISWAGSIGVQLFICLPVILSISII